MEKIVAENIRNTCRLTHEGTSRGATLHFFSFIAQLIEDIELVKSLKGFVRRAPLRRDRVNFFLCSENSLKLKNIQLSQKML